MLTRDEYMAGVRELAADLKEEAVADGLDRDEFHDRVWETIDGHEWVIYTVKAKGVVCNSDNEAYSIETFGVQGIADAWTFNWSVLAFGALYADVMEALDGWEPGDGNAE